MENNLQNKAMFFAAYLFQSAVTEMSNPETITPYFLQYADLPIFQPTAVPKLCFLISIWPFSKYGHSVHPLISNIFITI
ncbi:hypothetical protein [Elizabethkingia miricola]|uniref:hypothetical protein n=1 Tax=Elizabethkingia miricola TaxID=172045 RepID=UPI00140E08CB|nr:hypothetical protein [Elizabethkingia miricola]NHQ68119.1 hypothetical protein [Elizabethkingia miricola]